MKNSITDYNNILLQKTIENKAKILSEKLTYIANLAKKEVKLTPTNELYFEYSEVRKKDIEEEIQFLNYMIQDFVNDLRK